MKLIYPPVDTVWKICGEKKYDPTLAYRLTTHCVKAECPDGELLFHTLNGAMVLLKKCEKENDNIEELVKYRFMVPLDFDDQQYADGIREILTLLNVSPGPITGYTILTTTDCNARCAYCYQKGCEHISMSGSTALDVVDFIADRSGGDKVSLKWFGGEPLCNVRTIDTICRELSGRNINFKSSMISNGSLFTPGIIKRAVDLWKLKKVQVTLDGTKEEYQRIKAYASGDRDAFDRILSNIAALSDAGISTVIRLNMDSANCSDLLRLCDVLAERFRGRSNIKVYAALLRDYRGGVSGFESEDRMAEALLSLNGRLREMDLALQNPLKRMLTVNRCMADDDHSIVIMPDGSFEKCEHFSRNERIGSLKDGIQNLALIERWKERAEYGDCSGCALYPRCLELKKCPRTWCNKAKRADKLKKLKEMIISAYYESISYSLI